MSFFISIVTIVFMAILIHFSKTWIGTKLGDVIIIFVGFCMMYGAVSIANDIILWLKG